MAGLLFSSDTKRDITKPQQLLLVDLDGTVRTQKLLLYPRRPSDVEIFVGVKELLLHYKLSGWTIMGISNQGGIAKNEITSQEVIDCMQATQEKCGGAFDGFLWCPHHPSSKRPEMAQCFCRKPKYGMIVQAQLMLHQTTNAAFPLHLMKMVGDQPEDKEAAESVGIEFKWAVTWRAEILGINLTAFPKPIPPKLVL